MALSNSFLLFKYHPGTETVIIDAFNDFQSFDNLWLQLHDVSNIILNKTSHFKDGYNLLCFSQGKFTDKSFKIFLSYLMRIIFTILKLMNFSKIFIFTPKVDFYVDLLSKVKIDTK